MNFSIYYRLYFSKPVEAFDLAFYALEMWKDFLKTLFLECVGFTFEILEGRRLRVKNLEEVLE